MSHASHVELARCVLRSTLLVDVQGVQTGKKTFTFKEVGVVPLSADPSPTLPVATYIFQEPRAVSPWISTTTEPFTAYGDEVDPIPYEHLRVTLTDALRGAAFICVKGLQKVGWLRPFAPQACIFIDLEKWGCPRLETCVERSLTPHQAAVSRITTRHLIALFDWCTHAMLFQRFTPLEIILVRACLHSGADARETREADI